MTIDVETDPRPPVRRIPLCFTTRITLIGAGRFSHDPEGELAQIASLRNRYDYPEDLIAWFLDAPGRWYAREGSSPILGCVDLAQAASFGWSIAIQPTPAAWVAAGGTGVCVLDWQCSLAGCFEGISAITTNHLAPGTAQNIEKLLRKNFWRDLPRIGGHRGR